MRPAATANDRFLYAVLWSVGVQAALLVSSLSLYAVLGLSVDWESAVSVVLVAAVLAIGWLYFTTTRSSTFEMRLARASLAIALLLMIAAIMTPAQYAAAALNRPLIDPALAKADSWLGIDVATLAAWTRNHPRLSAALTWGYFTLLWQFALVIPLLAIVGDDDALAEYLFNFHLCSLITVISFAVFPAASAFQYLDFESTLPQSRFIQQFNGVRSGQLTHLVFGQMEGLVSMPSFHAAGALMVTWATRRHLWLFVPLIAVNALLCAATFLSGAHYFVDTVAAVALVALSAWAWRRLTGGLAEAPGSRTQPARTSAGGDRF